MKQPFIASIVYWFKAPVFDGDEEKTYRAGLLNGITVLIILFMIFLLPIVLPSGNIPNATKLIDLVILLIALTLRYFLFKGKVKEVSFWFVISGFTMITADIVSLGTIQTPTTAVYLFIVITSGILFDLKGIIISSVFSSLIVACFIIAKNLGFFPEKIYSADLTHWALYTLLFTLVGGLTHFSFRSTVKALEHSKNEIAVRIQTEAKLRASEARFRNLFEQTHDAVLILDLNGYYLDANLRALDMLGYSIKELLTLSYLDITAQPDQSNDIRARLLDGKHIPHYERYFKKKDGTIFPVEIYLELIKDEMGNSLYIQCVVRDISQRKETEDALKNANEQLNKRIEEIETLHLELKEQAIRDPLTGLYNRRFLNETLTREIDRAAREKDSLSLMIADIDNFKWINDSYGHQAGDCFLVEIAHLLRSMTRNFDIVCRYGGEEFVMVMPGIHIEAAEKRAEEIRQMVEGAVIQYQEHTIKGTVSLGLAVFPQHGIEAEKIIIKADRALYQSKQAGRNQVTVWREV